MRKKALVLIWNSFNYSDVIKGLMSVGFECDYLDIRGQKLVGDNYTALMLDFLKKHPNEFDLVFSTNYFQYIAIACHECNIHYMAWTYDSPWSLGDVEYIKFETTHVFMFDSDEASHYRRNGLENVFYLPLAVDTERYDSTQCSHRDKKRFKSQGSFVGQLYNDRLNSYLNLLDDYKKAFFNGVVDYCVGVYDSYLVEEIFSRKLAKWFDFPEMLSKVFEGEGETKDPLADKSIEAVYGRINYLTSVAVTNKERLILLSLISKHWELKLFSNSSHRVLNSSLECGTVDYYSEMPKVFKCSDINMNITVKSIKAGIPLRCLDIMGCGGFLLSNYQRDFDEHFRDGYNIALFSSIEEAVDKFKYYIENDDARRRIAQNGYQTVKELYSYSVQLKKAFDLAGLKRFID